MSHWCCTSLLLESQDDRCWRACLKPVRCSVQMYTSCATVTDQIFTAADIISKCEKDTWSRQIHSVTCTRSNTTPSWRYQHSWAGGDRKQKIKSLWKSVLSSRLCVNMRVCKSSMFMQSRIHVWVCVWWEDVCREAVRGVVINRVYKAARAVSPTGMRLIDLYQRHWWGGILPLLMCCCKTRILRFSQEATVSGISALQLATCFLLFPEA